MDLPSRLAGAAIVLAWAPARADDVHVTFVGGYQLEPVLVGASWQDRNAFSEIRPGIRGSLYRPWLTFKTSVELARNPPYLVDAYVDVARWPELAVRIGQFKAPFSRAEDFDPEQILFPDQPVVADYFWTGRDKGAMAWGALGSLHYWAGLFGGSPLRQPTTIPGNYIAAVRLTYGDLPETEYPYIAGAPLAVSASVEAYTGKVQAAVENFDASSFEFVPVHSGMTSRRTAAGGDVFVQAPTFAVFGEAFYGRTDVDGTAARSWGAWAQASYLLIAGTLDIAIRAQYLDPDLHDTTFASTEGQLAWYVDAPHVLVKLRYGIGRQRASATDVALPVEVAGTFQVITAQLTLAL